MWIHLTEYEHWQIDMELQGKEVPCPGDVIYVPYDDDMDCFCETWDGNLTQREYVEQDVCFPTANEAVAKARRVPPNRRLRKRPSPIWIA